MEAVDPFYRPVNTARKLKCLEFQSEEFPEGWEREVATATLPAGKDQKSGVRNVILKLLKREGPEPQQGKAEATAALGEDGRGL